MILILIAAAILTSAPILTDASSPAESLKIDPLLLAEAAQVWELLGSEDNPVWPGWDVRETPMLFYLPGVQDVLVNHPSPPPGFSHWESLPGLEDFELAVRNGETLIDLDGQNTSKSIGGVSTLVVADTVSNRRVSIDGLLVAARRGEPVEVTESHLRANVLDQMAMIAHEAFHVFQDHQGPDKRGNEMALMEYPVLSVANNVGFGLEAEALTRALRGDDDELEEAARAFLAARQERRRELPAPSIAYEDGTEYNEGVAKYIEWALFHELEGVEVVDGLQWAQGFEGLEDLESAREGLLTSMGRFMRGEVHVNNDPYGTAPARMRLYWSGMGLAALLDRLEVPWKDVIFEDGVTLTGILEDSLDADPESLEEALVDLKASLNYESLMSQKRQLLEDGRKDSEELAERILSGQGTTVVFDYSELSIPGVGLSFTPFGLRVIDEDRVVYSQIPMRASFLPGFSFQQKKALPLLQHKFDGWMAFRLEGVKDVDELLEALGVDEVPTEPIEVNLDLPEARIDLRNARISIDEGRLVLRLKQS